MFEVEVKVRAAHALVRHELEALGADHEGVLVQADTYFGHPGRSFAETDEALRIRRQNAGTGDVAYLSYKGPLIESASKTREELETRIEDADTTRQILTALGFTPVATVHKERDRYGVDGYAVLLDSVRGLGEFVEIEAIGDTDDIESLRDGARGLLRRLGLDPTDHIRTSYLELLLAE